MGGERVEILNVIIVVRRGAGEYAHARSCHFFQRITGIFQRLPGHFQQHALLGVQGGRFARGDAKEGRIKSVDLGKEAALSLGSAVVFALLGVMKAIFEPAFAGNVGDRIHPIHQHLPKSVDVVYVAGESTANTRHRDRDYFHARLLKTVPGVTLARSMSLADQC